MLPWKTMMLLLFSLMTIIPSGSHAYRIGDAVGMLIRTSTSSTTTTAIEAYRHQLPRFGISTRTTFDINTLIHGPEYLHSTATMTAATMEGVNYHKQQRNNNNDSDVREEEEEQHQPQHLRLSISFDDGFHHIPWADVYNNNNNISKNHRVLESLVITIIYSSGDGMIHAVHRNVKYTTTTTSTTSTATTTVPKKFDVEYIWINEADVDIQDGILTMFVCVLVMSLFGMIEAFRAGTTTTTSMTSSSLYMDNDRENDSAARWGGGRYTTNKLAMHEA